MSAKSGLLLHICCAPDATVPWPALASEFDATGFFYGNNIHPWCEWKKRSGAVLRLSSILGLGAEIAEYSPDEWFCAVYALSGEREGGSRCELCFGLQLESAARYAALHGYGYLCSTLSISPRKNPDVINRVGAAKADAAGVKWAERVWRKKGGFALSVARSREMGLYRQDYCGCLYSVRQPGAGNAGIT